MEHATIKVLEDTGLSMDDIKVIMPHQANIRILEGAAKRLNIPNDKVFSNLHNTAIFRPHPYLWDWMRLIDKISFPKVTI